VTRHAKERASFLKINDNNDILFFRTSDCYHCCSIAAGMLMVLIPPVLVLFCISISNQAYTFKHNTSWYISKIGSVTYCWYPYNSSIFDGTTLNTELNR
jgi:hypothetical protein